MRVLIVPAAGAGQRFKAAGYDVPKPFISLPTGDFMLQRAVQPFTPYVNDVQLALPPVWRRPVGFEHWLKDIHGQEREILYRTGGAALTVLSMIGAVEEEDEVIVANSDQFFEGSAPLASWFAHILRERPEVSVLTFLAEEGDTRWSYVLPYHDADGQEGDIAQIVEKRPAGRLATCGAYYVRRFGDLVTGIARMVAKNDRTNGEFYLAPALNYISGRRTWHHAPAGAFWSVGTPELLAHWREHGPWGI